MGLLLAALPVASGQSLDVFAGLNALSASQAVSGIPRLGGGLFPSAGVNLFFGPVGLGGEVAFRAQGNSSNLRPIYYDFNLLLAPVHIARSAVPELMVGVGAQSIQALTGTASCGGLSSCASYAGSNLAAHVGVGLKVYVTEHIFVRPEAHFYFIRNNSAFGTSNTRRFGVSLGYSFGG
ncbi:MAG: outer membrane beta-barrel protein [Terriglobales bacterium]